MTHTIGTLYEQFGGKTGIGKVVDRFYEKVLDDELLRPFFANTEMEAMRRHQTAFISQALGGPQYSGRSMEKAHAGLNLQPQHFQHVVNHLVHSLQEFGVAQPDIDQVVDRLAPLQDAILYK